MHNHKIESGRVYLPLFLFTFAPNMVQMVTLGDKHILTIERITDFGFFLDGRELGEILLPNRYMKPSMKIGDQIEVMIYLDGEERIVATTEEPLAVVGDYAYLKVNKIENVGAFCDWGLMKELLVPFSEQKVKMEEGRSYLVYVYIDPLTERITGSMKLEKYVEKIPTDLVPNQEVDIIIWTQTDIGYKVIINNKYLGILYKNEVFKKLANGYKTKAYIKKVREDHKIDLTLTQMGIEKVDKIAYKILSLLEKAGGKLPYNDKTDPEVIYNIFGISKKAFKLSIGGLFKQREILITPDGIEKV